MKIKTSKYCKWKGWKKDRAMDNITVKKKKKKKKLKGELIGMSVNISTNLGSADKQFGRLETFNQGGERGGRIKIA